MTLNIGGTHSETEEKIWLEKAEQKWLIAQPTVSPPQIEFPLLFPLPNLFLSRSRSLPPNKVTEI
jgi:hypothetical protein